MGDTGRNHRGELREQAMEWLQLLTNKNSCRMLHMMWTWLRLEEARDFLELKKRSSSSEGPDEFMETQTLDYQYPTSDVGME